MVSKKTRLLVTVSLIAIVVVAALGHRLFFSGVSFLVKYLDARVSEENFTNSEVQIPSGERTIPARTYTPSSGNYRSTILLIHGVHSDGYNEQRLIHFTRTLVGSGFRVVTPDIVDLRNYEIIERAVDDIERAAMWLMNESNLLSEKEKFALWGISFAGGLCLSLAAAPGLRNHISSSFSFGGHGNLDTTMNYLMTGEMSDKYMPPHIYGQAVLVRRFAKHLVPAEQVAELQDIILHYLKGDHKTARQQSEKSRPETAEWLQLIFRMDVTTMGKLLKQNVGTPDTAKRLSATKGPPPQCNVHLLHGSMDNVIPPSELHRLESWAQSGDARVYSLVSDLINHVELDETQGFQILAYIRITRFWNELLRNS